APARGRRRALRRRAAAAQSMAMTSMVIISADHRAIAVVGGGGSVVDNPLAAQLGQEGVGLHIADIGKIGRLEVEPLAKALVYRRLGNQGCGLPAADLIGFAGLQ